LVSFAASPAFEHNPVDGADNNQRFFSEERGRTVNQFIHHAAAI